MYQKIKQLADEAVALQNKDRMDAALREISAMCDPEVLRQLADSAMLASTSTSFPFDRAKFNAVPAPGESLPVFLPADAPAGTAPGSTVAATGISDGAGNETTNSVTVTPSATAPAPAKGKKGGAK